MEDGRIKDHQIKTSQATSSYAQSPRLNSDRGFIGDEKHWPFIQADLGPALKQVTAIAVQGRGRGRIPWTFYVKYMKDVSEWFNYAENGVVQVCKFHVNVLAKKLFYAVHYLVI